jgi:hypothetical protein
MKRIKGHAHQGMPDSPATGETGAATSDEAKTELLIRHNAIMSAAKDKSFMCCLDIIKKCPPLVYYLIRSKSV